MDTIIYLIRHAEQYKERGIYNSNNNDQEKNEKIILSVNGEKQAEQLSKNKELKNIDFVWSSQYARAKATAKYICFNNNIELNIDNRLNERKLGNNEELRKIGKDKKYRYVEEQLLNTNLKTQDGENANEVNLRFTNFINEILEEEQCKRIVVVSHGGAMKFYLLNFCKPEIKNDKVILKYKNEELAFNSPGIIKLIFEGNKIKDIQLIA